MARRTFDHDAARARFGAGESVRALALEYGVANSTMRNAVCDVAKETTRLRVRRNRRKARVAARRTGA